MKLFREKIFTLRSYTPIPFLVGDDRFCSTDVTTMITGFIIVVIGELMRFWGVAYAGSLTRVTGSVGAPEVIVAGPFAYVRNPLYVGNLLMYIGIGIMSNALFPWLVFAAAVWFVFQYYQIVLLEEGFLEKEFSSSYLEFKRNVPRFIPAFIAVCQSDPVETAPELERSGALRAANVSSIKYSIVHSSCSLVCEVVCGSARDDHRWRSIGRFAWLRCRT